MDGGLDRVVQINGDKGEILFKESPRQVPGESVIAGGLVSAYTFTVDVASSPPQIDLKPKNTKLDGDKISLGILRMQKGRLELCIASPGDDRPTDFSSKTGSRSEYYDCVSEKKVKQP